MDTEVISIEEFQERVKKNIAQADKEARELAREFFKPKPKTKRKPRKPKPKKTERQVAYQKGVCKGCGVPWHKYNPTCHSCRVRWDERNKKYEKKIRLRGTSRT